MHDWLFKQGARGRIVNWLGIDAWFDSKLAESWERTKDRYDAASTFFYKFRLTGWRRLLNELVSDALTLGVGGLMIMYALAVPAFQEADESKWQQLGQLSVTFLDAAGNEIGKRGININDAVPLEEIPRHMIQATLATEDRRFFDHHGVDFLGTLRALVENLRANDVVQGGSGLTQQLAKNLFLSSERSIQRKLKEVFLSFWLESRLTKKEILKLYLDRAYMGGGAFGVEAASQFYFGKSVRDISLAEAAMLAGLYKAPTKYAPHINLPAARARANEVLSNLVEAGFYTPGQVYSARLNPARPIETRRTQSPDWFLDFAYEEVQKLMAGKGQYVLTARTTIDSSLQKAAEEALTTKIREKGRYLNVTSGALVSMETDGATKAIVGGLDYGESQFNRAITARRQPGSSFKTYVYAMALEKGYTSSSRLRDAPVYCGNWSPQNYNGGSGSGRTVTMADAIRVSLNTTAVAVSLAVDRRAVVELTKKLGINGVRPTCSMALGDTGITVLEHTGGYATFANGGKLAKPYAVLDITNSRGEVVYSRERDAPEPEQVVKRSTAEQINQMLQGVVEGGTGGRARLDFTHAVGKTGTSSSYRDAWFVGFTGKLVTGVWLGNDDYRPTNRVTGGSLPAEVWQTFMSVAHPVQAFPPIPGLEPHPHQVAERARLLALGQGDPTDPQQRRQANSGQVPPTTRAALAGLAEVLKAAGAEVVIPKPATPAGAPGAGRRAEAPRPRIQTRTP
ncbi:MAG: PBP1A family penicillin-binding protein [Hyphomicrobiaceae bacterium]